MPDTTTRDARSTATEPFVVLRAQDICRDDFRWIVLNLGIEATYPVCARDANIGHHFELIMYPTRGDSLAELPRTYEAGSNPSGPCVGNLCNLIDGLSIRLEAYQSGGEIRGSYRFDTRGIDYLDPPFYDRLMEGRLEDLPLVWCETNGPQCPQ